MKTIIIGKTDSQDLRVKTETSGHSTEDGNNELKTFCSEKNISIRAARDIGRKNYS